MYRNNRPVNLQIRQKTVDDSLILTVDPPVAFAPGKYQLKITDDSGHTEEQDFIWGVLAINTDKSVYSPDEEAKFSFAVLDENGKMDCGAKLELRITHSNRSSTELSRMSSGQENQELRINDILSSENGKIIKTDQCEKKETSNTADFIASYKLSQTGNYYLTLTAETKNGSYNISDSISVEDNLPFIIERQNFPTRINPFRDTEVGFRITANQDFTGQIVEAIPDMIQIASNSATPYHFISTAVNSPEGLITGTDSPMIIRYPFDKAQGKPFEGSYPITLKFSENILDAQEKPLYEKYGLAGHDGVDFGLPEGTAITAVDDGHIILAGAGAYGVTVVIQHSWGRSYYGHLQGTGMNLGDKVFKGDKIGLSGQTGLATGPHLHFGVKFNNPDMKNGYYGKVDPLPYLQGSSIIPGFSVKIIGWNVSMKKGEIKNLGYKFDAPDTSPQLYSLGPLRLYETSSESQSVTSGNPFVLGLSTSPGLSASNQRLSAVFAEQRQWLIAVDAPETPPPAPSVLSDQSANQLAEKSVIHKGKPVNTNLKENAKAAARSRGEAIASIKNEDKLFRWEVELPNGTTFGFGLQERGGIKPVVRIRNREGWYVEFEPSIANLNESGTNKNQYVSPKVDGNQIEWPISDGIKARFTMLKDRIKADYIISSKSALDQLGQRLDFNVSYNDTDAGKTEEDVKNNPEGGHLTPVVTPDGKEIHYLGENNWTYFIHPAPTVKDSAESALDARYEIKKISQGKSTLSIILNKDQLESAVFPITIDPVTVDSSATATATAYGNGRTLLRDAWGNLFAIFFGDTVTNAVYYKSYNSTTWSSTGTIPSDIASMDIDSSGNLHLAFEGITGSSSADDIAYRMGTVSRNADNSVQSISVGNAFTLDTSNLGARPSLIIANKGEGAGKEKVAVAWAMNTAKGSPKAGEIRFLQCDVADGCDANSEWKNASEAKDGNTNGMPSDASTPGAADVLFNVGAHTTHHAVLTQVPGRPARTPANAKYYNALPNSYTNLSEALDENVGTDTGTTLNSFDSADYIFIGDDTKFSRVIFDLENTNSNAVTWNSAAARYCSVNSNPDTACDTWTEVANPIFNESSSTAAFNDIDGSILFDEPSDWVLSTEGDVGSGTAKKYWFRFSSTGTLDSTVSLDEIDVTDRHSHDLLIVAGVDSTKDMGAAYVIWDFIGQAGWENIPGDTIAPAPWRQSTAVIDADGGDWARWTNFPLTATVDVINNAVFISYICGSTASGICETFTAADTLKVKYIKNTTSITASGNWSETTFPAVTEVTGIVLSITSDQNDIYLFYVLDPGTNALVYRKCDSRGGGTRDICDNASDWSGELTLDSDTTLSHPQAVVSKAFGDTTAIDVIYTDADAAVLDVIYERHYVNMADKTIVVAASGDDAVHTDCTTATDSQDISTWTLRLGKDADACSGDRADKHIGLRFPSVLISPGAAISSAYIDFRVSARVGSTGVDFTIFGEDPTDSDSDLYTNVANCSGDGNCVNNRAKTTTSSTQSINFSSSLAEGNSYRFEVTDMIQEIVCEGASEAQPCIGNYANPSASPGWTSGYDISIILRSDTGGSTNNYIDIIAFDNTATTMLDPTLQINLGNTGKRYSMGVFKTNSGTTDGTADLAHPLELQKFAWINNASENNYASVSASLVPSASSSASPVFQFKVNNSNNNNTDAISVSAIVKSSIPSNSYGGVHYAGKQICLQVYDTSSGWASVGSCDTATKADTDLTLSGTVAGASTKYFTGDGGGSCSGSDCWAAFRIYQDAATEANQILYTDYFNVSFLSPTPTPGGAESPTNDQLIRHGAWWNASGVEQPFTF